MIAQVTHHHPDPGQDPGTSVEVMVHPVEAMVGVLLMILRDPRQEVGMEEIRLTALINEGRLISQVPGAVARIQVSQSHQL